MNQNYVKNAQEETFERLEKVRAKKDLKYFLQHKYTIELFEIGLKNPLSKAKKSNRILALQV